MRRSVITAVILAAAGLVLWAIVNTDPTPSQPRDAVKAPSPDAAPADGAPAATDDAAPRAVAPPPGVPVAVTPIEGLHVVPVTQSQPEPVIGSPARSADNPFMFEAKFTPWGGGIIHVLASRFSLEVDEHVPYPLQQRLVRTTFTSPEGEQTAVYRYPMAANSITVNGTTLPIGAGEGGYVRWQVVPEATNDTQATFTLTLAGGDDQPVLRLTRTWRIEAGQYDLQLDQRIENLSGAPLNVTLSQFGPAEMRDEGGYMGDRRRVVLGYLQPYRTNAEQKYVTTEDFDFAHTTAVQPESATLWPAAEDDPARDLVWVASVSRYFGAAMHAIVAEDQPALVPLERQFTTVRREAWGPEDKEKLVLLLDSAPIQLAAAGSPQATETVRTELFAGPLDPDLLKADNRYLALKLGNVIAYNLGGMCAFCTFEWLAEFLLAFLAFIESLVRDWGVAIMVLVAVVRGLLHPLTKKSQVNMMKMSKQMQSLQPEMERLKKKYGDDQQKIQQETLKLYREKGVNPVGFGLGCIPMVLQMPIWIALYAMLFFAIELRHEPAFYGVFQKISGGAWPFLADLSSPDRFLPLGSMDFTIPWVNWHVTAINILPILMAAVFFIQQKYMTAQTPTMSEQQRQQQKMMKWMVLLFPIFLYNAPSGLTLYILTSTTVGIIESKRVRAHVKELEESGKLHERKAPKPGGVMDRFQKMMAERMDQMQQGQGPQSPRDRGKKRR